MNYTGRCFALALLLLGSCTNNDVQQRKVGPADVYLDYKVWGEEESDSVTVLLQFRNRNLAGETVKLERGGVQLDGTALEAGTSKMTGAYYEVRKPVARFAGQHTITYTAADKKVYADTFTFAPFSLAAEPAETIDRGGLMLQLDGVPALSTVHLLMTDTAFATDDINEIDTVRNGQLRISRQQLSVLAPGPVNLQLIKTESRPVKSSAKQSGRLSINYTLQRELMLEDLRYRVGFKTIVTI